jgi:hypothetical protein
MYVSEWGWVGCSLVGCLVSYSISLLLDAREPNISIFLFHMSYQNTPIHNVSSQSALIQAGIFVFACE